MTAMPIYTMTRNQYGTNRERKALTKEDTVMACDIRDGVDAAPNNAITIGVTSNP